MEKYALREYTDYYNYESNGYDHPTPFAGALQCYCDSQNDGVKSFGMMNVRLGEDVKVCE